MGNTCIISKLLKTDLFIFLVMFREGINLSYSQMNMVLNQATQIYGSKWQYNLALSMFVQSFTLNYNSIYILSSP